MKTLAKWLAIATLATALFSLMPKMAVAQDDAGQAGFDDPTAMAAPPPEFIAPAEIKKMMDNHDTGFQLVDTQPEEAFAEGHIPGAINYPWAMRIKSFPIPLPRNKTLVFYGSCPNDTSDTVKQLAEFGYTNVKIMDGGLEKWIAMKYPVARSGASEQPTPDVSQLTAKPATAVAQVADSRAKSSAAK